MIICELKDANTYKSISENLAKGIDYLASTDLTSLPVGKYEIDGDQVFVLIQGYEPKAIEEGRCEAHQDYIDIQYVIDGSEYMGYMPVEGAEVSEVYDPKKDRCFMKWTGDLIHLKAGMCAIFFPEDGHMPGIMQAAPYVRKAVVKVKVN